jgi:murein DD-endopeptidase MepM/ murein hydrolase activator NlpD
MRRRLALLVLLCLAVAAPAVAGDAGRKQSIDTRIAALHARIAADRAREQRLAGAIKGVTAQIQTLEKQVGGNARKLASLQRDLSLHQQRLDKLTQLFELETRRLMFLRHEYNAAVERLAARVVGIYESDDPGTLGVILSSSTFDDILDTLDYRKAIASSDKHIAVAVNRSKHAVARARAKTKVVRDEVAAETRLIEQRTQQQQALQLTLIARRQGLNVTRRVRTRQLAATRTDVRQEMEEEAALAAESAVIAARIQAAQAAAPPAAPGGATDTTPSSSGLIWPVSGPVTSGFGMRWGRMHEGIDIAAGTGTPIHAAASGRVIYAGWMSGYGNFVIIDHGASLATAYGHQSRIAVGNGQSVTQGQVIGYVGCTGHCFGPHLHFEVRINGQPVNPLSYL